MTENQATPSREQEETAQPESAQSTPELHTNGAADANGETLDPTPDATAEAALATEKSAEESTEEITEEHTAEAEQEVTEEASAAEEAEPSAEEIIARLEAELIETRAAADAQIDKMQRTAAEFQNSKRRLEKRQADSVARASENMIRQLLPLIDDLGMAFANLPDDISEEQAAWLEGFRAIEKKMVTILDNQQVTEIDTDGLFDPNLHEAVVSEPSEEVESGHVIAVLRKGYEMKGRVLRPALVRVAM